MNPMSELQRRFFAALDTGMRWWDRDEIKHIFLAIQSEVYTDAYAKTAATTAQETGRALDRLRELEDRIARRVEGEENP